MAPTLSGQSSEADINSANQWMRAQPWYQDALRQLGQDPARGIKLNDSQKKQLAQVIQAHGLPLPDNDEIDPAGNVNPKGHKMRNFLVAAAIGGATIATLGAAGAFAGGAAAAGAGGAGAAGAGTLGAASTVPLAGSLAAGGVASGAVPAALAAGGTAAGTAGTVAGTAAAAKGLGALGWASLAGNLGSQAVGGILQYKAGNKATDAQSKAAEEALAFLKERDARNYADLATYRNAGQAATLKGMALQGLSAPPLNPTPMATNPNSIPAGQPFPASWVPGNPINAGKGAPMSALLNGQTPGDASFAVVQTPSGQRVRVPHGELADAIAHGGQVLS